MNINRLKEEQKEKIDGFSESICEEDMDSRDYERLFDEAKARDNYFEPDVDELYDEMSF